MNNLWWQTVGTENCHLVLLHGWGLNAEVWRGVLPELSAQFTVHLVDLPGYGRSRDYGAMSLAEMANCLLEQAPEKALWLGWSLGGLVASQAALMAPERFNGLCTVASSPCFSAQEGWPGIRPDILAGFQHQLADDFQRTVTRFLALQTLGTETARQDARALKEVVLAQPMPTAEVLDGGLEILKTCDLREPLAAMTQPLLRLYGRLDGLVPRKIVPLLDACWPASEALVIDKAGHAPFISHPQAFCQAVIDFGLRCTGGR